MRKGDFLAVVARNEWAAIKAANAIRVSWTAGTGLPDKAAVFAEWRKRPIAKEEVTQNVGDAKAALDGSARRIKATYDFAVQTHATIGPSCAVADFKDGKLTVWTSSQATHSMQHELSVVTGLSREAIRLVFIEGAGCYGRNGTEDAAADASLISMTVGQPVRLQWSRADETARSPKSPPRTMDMEAGLDAQGNVVAWSGDFYIALNHIAAFKPLDFPLLAAMETGIPRPGNWVGFLFQNSGQPYLFPNIRVNTKHVAEAFFRSSHLRSPGRIENSFANEAFMDELAAAAKADPAEYRLRYLKDQRAIDCPAGRDEAGQLAGAAGSQPAGRQRPGGEGPRHLVPALQQRDHLCRGCRRGRGEQGTRATFASPASAPATIAARWSTRTASPTRSKAACCKPSAAR